MLSLLFMFHTYHKICVRRAAVDLTSEGVKRIGGDSFDDDDRKALDDSGRLIKEAVFGDSKSLSDTVSDILGD